MRRNRKGKLEIMKTFIAIEQPELLENIKALSQQMVDF